MRLHFFPRTRQLENHLKITAGILTITCFWAFHIEYHRVCNQLWRHGNSVWNTTSRSPRTPLMSLQMLWFIPWRCNMQELPGSACGLPLVGYTLQNTSVVRGSSVPGANCCFRNCRLGKREQSTTPTWYYAIQCMFYKSITTANNANHLKLNILK